MKKTRYENGLTGIRFQSEKRDFLNARLALAEKDSIGLVVDLIDSMLYLEIKGVRIHTVKISGYRVDDDFYSMNDSVYSSIFSRPVEISEQKGTLEKEPIIVRQAPKDTAEASQFTHVPDTAHEKPVRISLALQNKFKLIIREEKLPPEEISFLARNSSWTSCFIKNVNTFFMQKVPDHKPAIEIEIPKKEAISIYRALPFRAQAVVRI